MATEKIAIIVLKYQDMMLFLSNNQEEVLLLQIWVYTNFEVNWQWRRILVCNKTVVIIAYYVTFLTCKSTDI